MAISRRDGDFPLSPPLNFMRSLWRLNHALERVSKRMELALGVTAQQRMIVRCIGKYPGITSAELAGQLHLDPGTISISLGRLEKKGLLKRERSAEDRRRVHLQLSPKGRSIDRPASGTVETAVQALLAQASEQSLATTRRVLEELTAALEAEADRAAR